MCATAPIISPTLRQKNRLVNAPWTCLLIPDLVKRSTQYRKTQTALYSLCATLMGHYYLLALSFYGMSLAFLVVRRSASGYYIYCSQGKLLAALVGTYVGAALLRPVMCGLN